MALSKYKPKNLPTIGGVSGWYVGYESNQFVPESIDLRTDGDKVLHKGIYYRALKYSSGIEPGVSANWQDYWKEVGVSGAGSKVAVQDEGSFITYVATGLNFVGSGVTATNNNNLVTINIPGGPSGARGPTGPMGAFGGDSQSFVYYSGNDDAGVDNSLTGKAGFISVYGPRGKDERVFFDYFNSNNVNISGWGTCMNHPGNLKLYKINEPHNYKTFRIKPKTCSKFGSPWPELVTACQNGGTVNFKYSFLPAGTQAADGNFQGAYTTYDFPNEHTGAIGAVFQDWKEAFEEIYPKLTLNFTNMGFETGNAVRSDQYIDSSFTTGNYTYPIPHPEEAYIGDIRFGLHQIDGTNKVLAHSYEPGGIIGVSGNKGGDIHFDYWENWRADNLTQDGGTNYLATHYSMKYVAAHEIGHALGIGEDTDSLALMHTGISTSGRYDILFPSGIKASVKDLEAIENVYGDGWVYHKKTTQNLCNYSNWADGDNLILNWSPGSNEIGPAGPAGAAGATGPQGSTGATGATGPQGPAGSSGMSSFTLAGASGSSETVGDGNTLTVTGGNAIDTSISVSDTVTISHADTSSQNSVDNSGLTFIQDVTLDTYGHVTGLTSAAATDTTYSAGTLLDLASTTFNVDLTEAIENPIADGDYLIFLDGGATGTPAKESLTDLVTLLAGDGLAASSSVLSVGVDNTTIEINGDQIRVKDNGITGAKIALGSDAQGDIMYYNGTDWARLAAGTSGHFLKTQGAGANPVWDAASGGTTSDSFKTIDINDSDSGFIWGSNDVVAASSTDTLRFIAGTNITLESDATNDAIRITAAGGGGSGDITGVTITTDTGSGSKAEDTSGSADFSILGGTGASVTNSGATITITSEDGEIEHDALSNFVANEHIDWTASSAGTVHASNYTDTNTTYSISCVDGDNSDEEKIRLTDSGSGTDDIVLEAGTGLSIARSGDKITFTNTVSDSTLTTEQVQDIVGAMFSGNTETNTAVTYDDSDGTIDVVTTLDGAPLTTEAVQDIAGALVATGGTKTGITITYDDANGDMDFVVDHDAASNFVANEHVDHTSVTLTAGDGLTGGGDISANRTFAVSVDDSTIEINSDSLRVKDNGITGAKIALGSDAQGDVMYYNGTDWARLAAGTNGHFLKTQGSGADPVWASASTSGMSNFVLEDGDGTEVTINDGKEVKFVEGSGIDINWTDSSTGDDSDPYDLTFTVDHDAATNFVANEHVDHSGVTLTAGDGLTGGGDITASRSFAVSVDDSTIEINSDSLRVKDSGVTLAKLANLADMKVLGNVSGSAAAPAAVSILDEDAMGSNSATALATQQSIKAYVDSQVQPTLTTEQVQDIVGGMVDDTETGISVTYDDTNGNLEFVVDHDAASNFVANEHIDHTSVTLTAGDGLTGGGDISANRTFAVSVDDSTIEINSDSLRLKDSGTTLAKMANLADMKVIGNVSGGAATPAAVSILDEDNMASDSATSLATQQSIKAYVDSQDHTDTTYSAGTLLDLSSTTFNVDLSEAGEAAIANGDYILFLDGGATGTHAKEAIADVATLFAGTGLSASNSVIGIDAAQTGITSLLATDIKIGEDDQTKIDFGTVNEIHLYADNTKRVTIDSTGLTVNSGSLETATIDYTDGDNAITIADGGGCTFPQEVTFSSGFDVGSDAEGDMLYHNGTTYVRLAKGTDNHVLTMNGNVPNWEAASGGGSGDITAVVAGALLDGGATSGSATLDVDLTEAGEAAIANGDYILFLDGGATGTHAKEAIADVATLFAGTGLTASSSVINIDAAQTGITSLLATDIKIGEDDQTKIDFETANQINLYADNANRLTVDSVGITVTGNVHTSVHDYGTTADINVDFDEDALQKATLNGNVAIDTAAANKGAGKSIVIKILCDGTARNFTWNSSWVFIGEKPASIAASKTALLSMTCFGTNETDVVCGYAVQD